MGFAVAFCFPRDVQTPGASLPSAPSQHVEESEIHFVPLHALSGDQSEDTLTAARSDATGSSMPDRSVTNSSPSTSAEPIEPVAAPSSRIGLRELIAIDSRPETPPANDVSELLPTPAKPERERPAQDNGGSQRMAGQPSHAPPELPTQYLPTQYLPTQYIVQPGDTLSGIAQKTLGSHSRYQEIFAANQDQLSSPDDLRLGQSLRIPGKRDPGNDDMVTGQQPAAGSHGERSQSTGSDQAPNRFHRPEKTPFVADRQHHIPLNMLPSGNSRVHHVHPGDTLEGIAVRYFGTTRAVAYLRRLNPQLTVDPHQLLPGKQLRLTPEDH